MVTTGVRVYNEDGSTKFDVPESVWDINYRGPATFTPVKNQINDAQIK